MFVALTDIKHRTAHMHSMITLERAFRGNVMHREHLSFDTKFAAPALGSPDNGGHLFVLLDGEMTIAGQPPQHGPLVYLCADAEIERIDPKRTTTFRTSGPLVRVVHLRFPMEKLRRVPGLAQGPIAVTDAILATADHISTAAVQHTQQGDEMTPIFAAYIEELARFGLVDHALPSTIVADEPERFIRLWRAVNGLYKEFATLSSLKELADSLNLSVRQAGRDAKEFARIFGIPGHGFRDTTRVVRLRAAALLLSAPDISVAEVAHLVGYGSAIAMGRAFRDAKLPAPGDIQAAIRAAAVPTA